MGKYSIVKPAGTGCEAVVVCCFDFRFGEAIRKHLKESLGLRPGTYDFASLPGGAKTVINGDGSAMKSIDLAVKLHQVNEIVIINHADCGAYGGRTEFDHDHEKEFDFHQSQLRQAKDAIADKHPDKKVTTLFLRFRELGKKLHIEIVEVH